MKRLEERFLLNGYLRRNKEHVKERITEKIQKLMRMEMVIGRSNPKFLKKIASNIV